jgi:tetratricopeptide (TPR) repeat protein
MGQILSDEGDPEEAINSLIDALRWNPKNGYALLMMGNIFAKSKNDVPTAMQYYDQALLANVSDHISLSNIGYLLLQQNKTPEAKKYLSEAIKINSEYANTYFTLALIAEKENDLLSAFNSTVQAIKFSKQKDTLYQNAVRQAFDMAKKIIATSDGRKIYSEYRHKLEFTSGTEIDITEDAAIPTAAKIEFAENYNRAKHVVRYKPNYPAVEHLIMHELVHLDFVIEAKKAGLNQLFITTQQHKAVFIKDIEPTIKKLDKMGIAEDAIANYCSGLFEGMNRQVYNTPIDLFIEDFLYNEHKALRPYQFLSLFALIQEGIKAVTDKKMLELSPGHIVSKSKVYNIVTALQYAALFGIDFTKDFQATATEIKQANSFYEEYGQYKEDKEPAEEYELAQHWAEDLQLDKNFELIDETTYRTKRTDIDNLLQSIEKDPYDTANPYKEREMDKFQKGQQTIGTNMAVTMFMVDALQYFDTITKEKIKIIAVEIAMNGTQGYRPDGKDYRISAIPGKLFSGYHILAYYYVSWALTMPEQVEQLGLPYQQEYELATQMHQQNSSNK